MIIDLEKYAAEHKKDDHEQVIQINKEIDGRVCVTDHLYFLLSLKNWMAERCSVYVETGTLWGGSLALAMRSEYPSTFIGIDLFKGYYGKTVYKNDWNRYSEVVTDKNHLQFTTNNIERLNIYNHPYHLVKGSSYDKDVVNKVRSLVSHIDILFIDGDHSEEGVLGDFNSYKDMISPGGFILFDNYAQRPNMWPGVESAIKKIDFNKEGFTILKKIGFSLLVMKTMT